MNLGDKVSFKYANIDRVGKIIGKTSIKTKFLIEFEYKPNQTKTVWLHKNVLTRYINGEIS